MLAAVAEEEAGVEEEAVDEVLEQQKEKLPVLRLDPTPAHRFRTAAKIIRTLTH
jgi:hypothetical protein